MNFKKIFLIILIILLCVLYYHYFYDGTTYVKSSLDGNYYKVRSEENNQHKADLLSIIYIKLNLIVNTLRDDTKYKNTVPVKRLVSNWDKGISIKEIGKMESDAAYVINKKHMSFCLQNKPNNNDKNIKTFEDINLMTYVGIHELAHIMSDEIGHGNEFISNFEFLLDYSKQLTYFDKLLNKNMPVYIQLNKLNTADNYCGVPLINSIN
jgi:hypothetical protein